MKIFIDGIMLKQAHGGVSRVWRETLGRVAAHSPDYEFTVSVLSRGRHAVPVSPRIRSIIEWDLPPRALWKSLVRWRATRQTYDLFHSTYYTEPYVEARRQVVTVHDFNHERLPGLTGNGQVIAQKRRVIERADAIVSVSETTKQHLLELYPIPAERVTVMPLACPELFSHTPTLDGELANFRQTHRLAGPYWLYVGRRGVYKNFTTLVRAFAQVAKETGAMLVVAGWRSELDALDLDIIIRHGLEHRVTLLPQISDDDLRVAYAGAAGFVFPSLAEGFGLPLLEAMGAGAPVLASDIAVFHEVAADAALFFDPHSADSLAESLRQSLDPAQRERLIARGRERIKAFSWDKSAEILRGVYERVLAR